MSTSLRDLKAYGDYDAAAAEEKERARTASRESKRREEAAAKRASFEREEKRQEALRRKQWREAHPEEVIAERIAKRVVRRVVSEMAHKTTWSMNLVACRVASRGCDPPTPRAKPQDWDDKADGADYETGQSPKKPEVDWNSELSHFQRSLQWDPRKCLTIVTSGISLGGPPQHRVLLHRRQVLDVFFLHKIDL